MFSYLHLSLEYEWLTILKKSREKNVTLEETRRRNEASMRRKQMTVMTNGGTETPLSPASTGAMDTLLEKLRAAAPQPLDQRDRRRRARLKDKHQVRVASGQKMPDIDNHKDSQRSSSGATAVTADGTEESPTSPDSDGNHTINSNNVNPRESGSGLLSPFSDASEADVADRAASLLRGLRGSGIGVDSTAGSAMKSNSTGAGAGTSPSEADDSVRVRRRRESADNERTRRRARRAAASAAAAASAEAPSLNCSSGAILEEVVRANMNDAVSFEDERKQQQHASNHSSYHQEKEAAPITEHEIVDETITVRQLPAVTEEESINGEEEASVTAQSRNGPGKGTEAS